MNRKNDTQHEKSRLSERIYYWDNMKGILIMLVVIAHFASFAVNEPNVNEMNTFIFLFHMPLFIFIAGVFTKQTNNNTKYINNVVFYFALYFIVYTFLFIEMNYFRINWKWAPLTSGGDYLKGGTALWFMFAMFWYSLFAPVCRRIKPAVLIMTTVLLALISGYYPLRDYFAASRTIVFMPFFCMGLLCNPAGIVKWWKGVSFSRKVILKAGAAAGVVLVWLIIAHMSDSALIITKQLSKARIEYAGILGAANPDISLWQMLQYRCVWYAVVFGIFLLIFALCPVRRIPLLSRIGKNSIAVYIFHCFIYYPVNQTNLMQAWAARYPESVRILLPLGVGIGISLGLGLPDLLNTVIQRFRRFLTQAIIRVNRDGSF